MVQELTEPCSESNTIPPDTDAIRALSVMSKTGNSRLMVADGNILLGVITLKDLLGFLSLKLDLEDSGVRGRELLEVARKSA
jgi:predicted transcriptional regulator